MIYRWHPGDRAVIAYCPISSWLNSACTVMDVHDNSNREIAVTLNGIWYIWPVLVECNIDGIGLIPVAYDGTRNRGRMLRPEWLRPFNEWNQENVRGYWRDCVFQPKESKAVRGYTPLDMIEKYSPRPKQRP